MRRRINAGLLFFGAILLFAPPLIDVPFSTRGEAREALVVAAMIDQDELVLPLRNGTVIPSKPPLFHWIARGMVSLLGIEPPRIAPPPASASVVAEDSPENRRSRRTGVASSDLALLEFAIRLPSALAGALCLALLFAWIEPVTGKYEAFAAVAVLGSSFELMRSASIARVDMVFAATLSAGLIAMNVMIDRYHETRKISPLPFAGVILALAAAVLAKGPAGIALPWAIAGLYALLLLPLRAIPFGWAGAAFAGSLLIALGWYIPAYLRGGEAFLDVHLMRENVARIVGMDEYETGHAAPFYMTTLLFLAALLPWTILIPLLGGAADLTPRSFREKFARRPADARERVELFALLWVLFFIVFFSFTASKRSAYLLPALPPAAALLGPALLTRARGRFRCCAAAVGTLSFLLAVVACAAVVLPSDKIEQLLNVAVRKEYAREQARVVVSALRGNQVCFAVLMLGTALLVLTAVRLWQRQIAAAMSALAAGTVGIFLGISTAITPTISWAQTPRPFMEQVLAIIPLDASLSQYKHDFYAATFYGGPIFGGRVIPLVHDLPEKDPRNRSFVLAAASDVPILRDGGRTFEVALASSALDLYGKDRLVLLELNGGK